ncbi:MAG: endonuclease/exonuclease/phosphatase family protein [Streptosporangiaceae bacterium]
MPLPRTSAQTVLFTTYNVLDLFLPGALPGSPHYEQVVAAISELDTDVLAIQELRGSDSQEVAARLAQLANDVGMCCLVPSARPGGVPRTALAMGTHGFHCGVLWRGGIEPVPGSLRTLGRGHFWHSLACLTLSGGGRQVRHAAFHATPFGRLLRADQNERLVAMLTGPRGSLPLLIGADWNTESADRVRDEATGRWVLYEPADPYAGLPWMDDMIYQCEWDYDESGQRRHWADRRPGDVLWAGGLHDAAAALRAPWRPTIGHYPGDRYGAVGIARRIDAIRVTRHVLPALRAYHLTDTELTRQASDHLPVTVEYDPAAVALGDPGRP